MSTDRPHIAQFVDRQRHLIKIMMYTIYSILLDIGSPRPFLAVRAPGMQQAGEF